MATVVHCDGPSMATPSAPSPPAPTPLHTHGDNDVGGGGAQLPPDAVSPHLYPLLEGPPAYATLPFKDERSSSDARHQRHAHNLDHVTFAPTVDSARKRFMSANCEYQRFELVVQSNSRINSTR